MAAWLKEKLLSGLQQELGGTSAHSSSFPVFLFPQILAFPYIPDQHGGSTYLASMGNPYTSVLPTRAALKMTCYLKL